MLVFDVSAYNTGDLPPCDGLIARTTTMDSKSDSSFGYWVEYAKRNNLIFGAYKYTYAENRIMAELESITVAKKLQNIDLPLGFWLDCETSFLRYCSNSLLKAIIDEYKETMELYRVPWGGIYCDYDFYKQHTKVLAREAIWLARWTHDQNKRPAIFDSEHVKGWQYTNRYNGKNLDASLWKRSEQGQEEDKRVLYNPDNVRKLQEYLNKHYNYELKVDGVMGTNTFTAICQSLAL